MPFFHSSTSLRSILIFTLLVIVSSLMITQQLQAGPIRAYFADEHNTSPTSPTGNRILEIDLESMTLVNSIDVPGIIPQQIQTRNQSIHIPN